MGRSAQLKTSRRPSTAGSPECRSRRGSAPGRRWSRRTAPSPRRRRAPGAVGGGRVQSGSSFLRIRGDYTPAVGDILYAFRTFRRGPLGALTIVVTVGLGLGLVTVLFTILNLVLFRVDEVRNPGELFGVERPRMANGDRVRLTR